MARIFISHNSNDAKEAVALKRWLADNGWDDTFLDIDAKEGLSPGERWKDALKNAADRCEAVLCLVSPTWLASSECRLEFRYAETLRKHLFLALVKPCNTQELPPDWQWCPLYGDGAQTTIHFDFREHPTECAFLTEGLERLKIGLQKAGISAEYFPWPPGNDPERAPYRGLKPLEAADAAVFFGRNAQVLHGMEALWDMRRNRIERLLVILGASGSGKSSFMRAGLLPRLARDDRQFFTLPVIRPRNAVMFGVEGLAPALTAAFGQLGGKITLGEIENWLNAGPEAFDSLLLRLEQFLLNRIVGEADVHPPSIVFAIDQAEELFNPDGAAEADSFLALLAGILADSDDSAGPVVHSSPRGRAIVLLTIRSDRYERLQTAPGLSGVKPRLFDLRPFPPGQFERVINGPAERATQSGRKLAIDSRLTERLLADFSEGADTLPLLGFALEKLYHKYGSDGDLTLEDYEAIRGSHETVQAAIFQETIDTALQEPYRPPVIPFERAEQEQGLRRAFIPFLARINPENNEPMRQVAKLAELPADIHPLVERLVDARLLIRDKDTIEVAHESLLRQWPSLRGWLIEDLDNLLLRDSIRRLADEWKKEGQRVDMLATQGERLTKAEALLATPGYVVATDSDERAYLNACREAQQKREAKKREQHEREISNLKKIAEEERKAAEAAETAKVAGEEARVQAVEFAKRSLRQTRIAAGIALVAVIFFLGAIGFGYQAYQRLIQSEASVLWHPLDFSDHKVNDNQRVGLLDLARSGDPQKRAFLEQLLADDTLAVRFNHQSDPILRAAVGLGLDRRDWFLKRLYKNDQEKGNKAVVLEARALALMNLEGKLNLHDAIVAIQAAPDSFSTFDFSQGLVALAGRVPEVEAGVAAQQLLATIQALQNYYQLEVYVGAVAAIAGRVPETEAGAVTQKFLALIQNEDIVSSDYYLESLAAVAERVPVAEAEAVVQKFLTVILTTQDYAKLKVLEHGLVTVTGRLPEDEAGTVAQKILAAIQTTQDWDQLYALSQGLAAAAGRVPAAVAQKFWVATQTTQIFYQFVAISNGVAALSGRASGAMAGVVVEKLLAAIQTTKYSGTSTLELSNCVAAVAGRVPEAEAGAVAQKFLAAILTTEDFYTLEDLAKSVAAVAGRVPDDEAVAVAQKFLAAIQITQKPDQLGALAKGVAAVAGRVPDDEAGAVAQKFLVAITATQDSEQLRALSQGLAALPGRAAEAMDVAVAQKFLATIQTIQNSFQSRALGLGLVAVAGRVPESEAVAVAEKFLSTIQNAQDPYQLEALAKGVVAVAGQVPDDEAGEVAQKFLAAFQTAQDSDQLESLAKAYQLDALVGGGAAVAGKVPEVEAGEVVEKFLAAIQKYQAPARRDVLGQGLAAAAARVPKTEAEAVVQKFLTAIQGMQEDGQRYELGDGLAAVAGRVPEAAAGAVAQKFLSAIQTTWEPGQLNVLGQGLVAVSERISQEDKAASLLFEALKHPLVDRDTIIDAIRKRFPKAPPKEQGFWALIVWADTKDFRGLDLEAPLPTPEQKAEANPVKASAGNAAAVDSSATTESPPAFQTPPSASQSDSPQESENPVPEGRTLPITGSSGAKASVPVASQAKQGQITSSVAPPLPENPSPSVLAQPERTEPPEAGSSEVGENAAGTQSEPPKANKASQALDSAQLENKPIVYSERSSFRF